METDFAEEDSKSVDVCSSAYHNYPMSCRYLVDSEGMMICDALPEKFLSPSLAAQTHYCASEEGFVDCRIFRILGSKEGIDDVLERFKKTVEQRERLAERRDRDKKTIR